MKYLLAALILFGISSCKREKSLEEKPLQLEQLSKGVNLVGWFSDGASPSFYKERFSKTDLDEIKHAGFTYIRIPIGRTILFQENNPSVLNTVNANYLDSAIQMAINAGLSVVLDGIHADNTIEYRIVTEPGFEDKVIAYWRAMAERYKKFDSKSVFFELFNEPFVRNDSTVWVPDNWWSKTQVKIVNEIRKITTEHYLVLTGNRTLIRGLKAAPAMKGERLIYNFHFYDPYLFTHQGSPNAGWDYIEIARDVPYPSSPEVLQPLINAVTDASLKAYLAEYGRNGYNIDSINSWISEAYMWGRENDVMMTCNEFGTYQNATPTESRARYFHDVRTILEKYHIGWAVWDYDLEFGITEVDGSKKIKGELLTALGLK